MSTMMLTAKKCAPEDIADLWDQFKKDPSRKELRNALIENYLPLVKYNGERIWQRLPDGVELDDLISAGVFGLMDAINAFDMGRGVKFETYCVPRIRGAMRGYSGFFDLVQIDESLLDKVYAYDPQLVDKVEQIGKTLESLPTAGTADATKPAQLLACVEELEKAWDGREDILKGVD